MKFSAWPGSGSPWPEILEECEHIERSGWDGIWIADHFMPNRPENLGPTQECWTMLAAIAARVPRVRLGTLVTGNTYRNPAVLAKEVAQVDVISGGRVILGIGAGWQQNEHEAYGIPFYTVGGRLRRLEEAVQIIRSLFDNDRTDSPGKYYKVHNAPLGPKPVQSHLPILIGGGGEKVTMRIAAQYADEWNTWGAPAHLAAKIKVLEAHCQALGRDPKSIKRSAQAIVTISDDPTVIERARGAPGFASIAGNVDEVKAEIKAYADAGVDEFIVPDFNLGRDVASKKAGYDRFIKEIAPAFR
jgi:F420-dependent oxidoreductase-like protein